MDNKVIQVRFTRIETISIQLEDIQVRFTMIETIHIYPSRGYTG